MRRYDCTRCQSVHYENGSAFLEHLLFQSKHGIMDGPPPPAIRAMPYGVPVEPAPGSIKARLIEALAIVRFTGDAYIVAAHAFVCHEDGSDCDATSISISAGAIGPGVPALTRAACKPDRESLHMLDAARALREANPDATIDDLVRAWAEHLVAS